MTISQRTYMNKDEGSFEKTCENCLHPISFHHPSCSFRQENDNICGCEDAEYHNVVISKYVGWAEIHCNSCGSILGFLNSTLDNIDDYTTLCPKCIKTATWSKFSDSCVLFF
jgi:hypothetical protein